MNAFMYIFIEFFLLTLKISTNVLMEYSHARMVPVSMRLCHVTSMAPVKTLKVPTYACVTLVILGLGKTVLVRNASLSV